MDSEGGMGWSLDFTKRVTTEYRRFLVLCKETPGLAIAPSSFVDDFWHFHILDTQKYQEDCESLFGYFLHHFPYFGMRGKDDEENLKKAWEETCQLYQSRFGELPIDLSLASKRCPNCGRRCKDEVKGYSMNERHRLSLVA
ncbi:MAG: hypothetical protein PHH59_16465 [Methylovulum sp.]|uniref:glycine-rich domain-containing protein n=1 Tax=Methylovulum sp. TaxID=1916980 RepID=UPI00261B865F|nr:hypothetical protein [Methylovulum sp.]MDD2725595.1 hypothetical protein [Methylovulum sp.]MDD5125691.1 hypothetical protein [Methylovulum sp.]